MMYLGSTIRCIGIAFVLFSLLLPPEVFGLGVEKRVVFTKAKRTVSYKGKLPRDYADYDAYYFRARKGQTLSVKLTTKGNDAHLAIYETQVLGPDEDTVLANEQKSRGWSGKLPVAGEYSVQVYGTSSIDERSSGEAYTIEVTLR